MPNVANYSTVMDNLNTLGVGAGQTPLLNLVLSLDQLNFSSQSVLSYMVDPDAAGMTFKMSIVRGVVDGNDEVIPIIPSTPLPAMSGHVRQEVIGGNVFGGVNIRLRIEVTAGSGKFSDIVLWYKSSV